MARWRRDEPLRLRNSQGTFISNVTPFTFGNADSSRKIICNFLGLTRTTAAGAVERILIRGRFAGVGPFFTVAEYYWFGGTIAPINLVDSLGVLDFDIGCDAHLILAAAGGTYQVQARWGYVAV